jgi:hypothetical protein
VKDSFYEELERVFDTFPKYHMKILLRDFNDKVVREDIFKPTIGNENLHDISNDNGVRLVNFAKCTKVTQISYGEVQPQEFKRGRGRREIFVLRSQIGLQLCKIGCRGGN